MTDIIIEVDTIETILDMKHRSLLIDDIVRVKGLMRRNRAIYGIDTMMMIMIITMVEEEMDIKGYI